MSDIFGYNRTGAKGVFAYSHDTSALFISGGGLNASATDLIQNWQAQYQQQITPIYEVGSSAIYWSKGSPVGTLSIGRIIGDSSLAGGGGGLCDTGGTCMITQLGSDCNAGGASLTLNGAFVSSVGFSAQAGQAIVSEQVTIQFSSLEI